MTEQMKTIKTSNNDYWDIPSFSVKADSIPEIKDWEVGKEYTMEVKVRMINKNEDVNSKMTRASLELVAYNYESDTAEDPSTPKISTDGGYMPNN